MPTVPPSSRAVPEWCLPALLAAAVAAFFLYQGLPAPDVDDLFFLGAPLHLVTTGELANPLLRRWAAGFGTDRYYLQMPLHPHLLAGWLAVLGVGTGRVLAFSWACYGVGAVGLAAFLRRFGWGAADLWRLLPVYLTLMVWLGQRPDTAAFALVFAGLGLLDARRAGGFGRGLAGFTLLGASVLCYPTTVFWAVALGVAEVARAASEDGLAWRGTLRGWAPALAAAVGLVGGLFVGLVRGEVREFLRVFLAHRALRAAPALPALVRSLLAGNKDSLVLPVFVLFPVLAAWAAFARGAVPARTRALVLGTFAAAVAGVGTYYSLDSRVGFLLGFFLSALALVSVSLPGAWRTPARLGIGGLFAVVGALWFLQTALLRPPGVQPLAEARARWEAESLGRTLFLDAAAARYLFDYRLPPGALDLFYAVPPPAAAVPYVLGERDVLWAVARPWLRYTSGAPPALTTYPKHTFHGRSLDTLPREPFEIVVVADR